MCLNSDEKLFPNKNFSQIIPRGEIKMKFSVMQGFSSFTSHMEDTFHQRKKVKKNEDLGPKEQGIYQKDEGNSQMLKDVLRR